MPYIQKNRRKTLDSCFLTLYLEIETKGELTYCLYRIVKDYIKMKGKSYQNISEAISSVADTEHELRRRVLNPYEDKKIKENGDI